MEVYNPVYPGLYYFDTFTFTTLGTSGHRGPYSTKGYANAPWRNGDFSIVDGQQKWTVPATGKYRIEAAGAYGATQGRIVSGEVNLNEGQTLTMIVGQQPTPLTANVADATTVGGGGGTFVSMDQRLLIVASGGDGTGGHAASFSPYGSGNGQNGGGYFSNGLATNATFKFLTPTAYIDGGFGTIFPTGVVPEEGGFGGGQAPVTSGISGGGGYTGSPGDGVSGATCYADPVVRNFTDLGATSNAAGYVTVISLVNSSKKTYSWVNRSTWSLSGIQLKNCKQVAWSSKLGKFIAINVGNYPTVEISSDGYQWSEIQTNLPLMSNLYDITNIKDSIILNNETGLWTSNDAINWKNTSSLLGEGRFTNTSSNVYFYCSSNIYISSDGYTWSMYPINVSGISRISYGNNIFVGIGFTTPYVYVSNNSVDWILALEGTKIVTSNSIGFSNGNFIVSGNNCVSYSYVTDNIVFVPPSELYSFQNVTFTTGGITGKYGPTLSQARNGLIGVPSPSTWSSTYLQMESYQGIQQWTVPKTGYYKITCAGGGGGNYNYSLTGGYGAVITILYKLTKGQIVSIVCGQRGGFTSGSSLGGFGGSFVFTSSELLVASGGGAGTVSASSAANASLTTKGNNAIGSLRPGQGGVGPNGGYGSGGSPNGINGQPGIAGDGGSTSADESITGSGGGGGWSSTSSFLGGNAGIGAFGTGDVGGFGLGGGTGIRNINSVSFTTREGAGGGGGYGGGGACRNFFSGTYSGGGGGSYFITNPVNASVNNNGPGYVTIEFIQTIDTAPWSNTNIGDTFTKITNLNNTAVGISTNNVWYSYNGSEWKKSNKPSSKIQSTFASSPSLGYSVLTDGQYSYLTLDGQYIVNSVTNSGGFQQIAWSPQLGIYVGTGTGLVSVSNDAKTWTSINIPLLSGISTIEWSVELGIFLVYCYGKVFISNDGYSWSMYNGPNQILSSGHKSIVWSPSLGIFTIGGRAISKDGINWQVNGSSEVRPIAWSPKLAIFTTGKYYSNNGLNWTLIPNGVNMTSITWSPKLNIFIAVDEVTNYYTSSDGINWNSTALRIVDNKSFIVVGKISSPYGMKSDDGKIWSSDTPVPYGTWTSITFGDGTFVATSTPYIFINGSWVYTGPASVLVSNNAGYSWTQQTFITTQGWLSITYGNNIFMAVGDYGTVITSSDKGNTWISKAIPYAGWKSVAYGNGLFMVICSGTVCAVSNDNGNTWTTKSMPDGGWKSVAYGNGVFIVVNNTGPALARTTDNGDTWTTTNPNPALVYTPWNLVIYAAGLFVAVGTNYIMTSNDGGQNWIYYNKPGNWTSVTYGNNLFTVVSSDSIISSVITSSDGINWNFQTAALYGQWSGIVYGETPSVPNQYTFPVITWSNELECFVIVATKRSYTYVFTSRDGISFTEEGNFQTFNQPLTSLICSRNKFLLANGSSYFVSEPIVSSL